MGENHFPRLHLNHGQDGHELKSWHSMELASLQSFFLHRLNSWVSGAFLCADHFTLLDLNQGRDDHELKSRGSFKLAWLKSFFLHRLKS
jgi:hypothetical protein